MIELDCEKLGASSPDPEGSSSRSPPLSRASSHVEAPEFILTFAQHLNMKIKQTKSQRKFGPPLYIDSNWEPEKGSEVFVGRIPWDTDERELFPFLEQAGSIFQIRLMTDLTNSGGGGGGISRGYCFVKYFNPEQAQLAVMMLHKQCIREGWPIVVSGNLENSRLVLFGVPTYIAAQNIAKELSKFGEVLKAELFCDPKSPPALQGIAYVTFVNHRAANIARKKLLESKPLMLWGKLVYVDWAEPEGLPEAVPLAAPFNTDQAWNLAEESYQVAEASGTFPPQPPRPAYQPQVIQPIYPLIPLVPVYLMDDQCPPPMFPQQQPGAEISGIGEQVPGGFFPGNVQFFSPPPLMNQPAPAAEEMFWYPPPPSPPPSSLPVAGQAYWEGGAVDDNNISWTWLSNPVLTLGPFGEQFPCLHSNPDPANPMS